MYGGIRVALAAGYHHLIVEGYNRVVIQTIQGHIHIPWQIQTLLQDVHNMLCANVYYLLQHAYRECNMTADWIVKYGCVICLMSFIFLSLRVRNFFLFSWMTI